MYADGHVTAIFARWTIVHVDVTVSMRYFRANMAATWPSAYIVFALSRPIKSRLSYAMELTEETDVRLSRYDRATTRVYWQFMSWLYFVKTFKETIIVYMK